MIIMIAFVYLLSSENNKMSRTRPRNPSTLQPSDIASIYLEHVFSDISAENLENEPWCALKNKVSDIASTLATHAFACGEYDTDKIFKCINHFIFYYDGRIKIYDLPEEYRNQFPEQTKFSNEDLKRIDVFLRNLKIYTEVIEYYSNEKFGTLGRVI